MHMARVEAEGIACHLSKLSWNGLAMSSYSFSAFPGAVLAGMLEISLEAGFSVELSF
jgi:hypothetical protein